MKDDRALARLKLGFPIAFGGHDHDLYHEIVAGQHILKLGQDSTHIGIVDLIWRDGADKPIVNVQVHDAQSYDPDPVVQKCIEEHEELITQLQNSTLTPFPTGYHMSSLGIRSAPTTIGTFLCTAAREGFAADCCVNRSGYIRGSFDYAGRQCFTYADLIRETPLDLSMVVITVPGQVIADMVQYSRTGGRIGSGDYLQIDNQMVWDEAKGLLTHIAGSPVVADKMYDMVFPYLALKGTLAPLIQWADEHRDELPTSEENGIPFQVALVEYWSSSIWMQLAKLPQLDTDGDGIISTSELKEGIKSLYSSEHIQDLVLSNVLAAADTDGDGNITLQELLVTVIKCSDWQLDDDDDDGVVSTEEFQEYLKTLLSGTLMPSEDQVQEIFNQIDTNGDGVLSKHEIRTFISTKRAKSLGVTGVGEADLLICW